MHHIKRLIYSHIERIERIMRAKAGRKSDKDVKRQIK